MPIKISDNLPAAKILESENVFVMTENRAMHQDIRPLKIVILNLMPTKVETETQLLRLLGNSPSQPRTPHGTRQKNIFWNFIKHSISCKPVCTTG